ncbi:MAG: type II toxin-antitoxin system VapB family antitoxin [Acidobacteriota bacterium]
MNKTTVVINEKLLESAIKIAGVKSKREAIEAGLRELIRVKNRELFRKELGTFDIEISLKDLEKLRRNE